MVSCLLCSVLASSPDVPFRRLFSVEDASSEVILETDTFAVVADVAPVVPGHCLIVSKVHAVSMAGMGLAALNELRAVVDTVEAVIGASYGRCCAFEHGSGGHSDDVACIEHAHMHIAPYDGDLHRWSAYRGSFVGIQGWHVLDVVAGGVGYLFTRSSRGEYWLSLQRYVERQHWRRVLAAAVGTDFQDWRLMSSTRSGRELARQRIAGLRELFLSDPEVSDPEVNAPHPHHQRRHRAAHHSQLRHNLPTAQ